jgi:hypothetical protein
MELYVTDKTLTKLKNMLKTNNGDSISVRKRNPTDAATNVITTNIELTDKQSEKHNNGSSYAIYINKERLKEINNYVNEHPEMKEGGILPLLPLILGGLTALGSVAGGTAAIVKSVSDTKYNNAKIEEEQRHNKELESAARGNGIYLNPYKDGHGLKELLREFTSKLKIDPVGQKTIRNFLKNLSDYVDISKQKNGNGIYLSIPEGHDNT